MKINKNASFPQGYSQPGSADCVFLNACRVSLSQQYQMVQHSLYPLKRNECSWTHYFTIFPIFFIHISVSINTFPSTYFITTTKQIYFLL
jgi:hypothetical protein